MTNKNVQTCETHQAAGLPLLRAGIHASKRKLDRTVAGHLHAYKLVRLALAGALCASCLAPAQSVASSASIDGRVVNSLTNARLRKVRVAATGDGIQLTAESDAEGRFQFSGLPPGSYTLSVVRPGFAGISVRRVVGANESSTSAELRMLPRSSIRGRVLDEDAEPVEGARVIAFRQVFRLGRKFWTRVNGSAETNENGEYRFSELSAGAYLVQAYDSRPPINNRFGGEPKAYVLTYYPNGLTQEQATPIRLGTATDLSGVDVRLVRFVPTSKIHLRGRVADVPPGSATVVAVTAIDARGHQGSATAHPPGYAFELDLTPGEYTIFANTYSGGPDAYGVTRAMVMDDAAGIVIAIRPAPELTGRVVPNEATAEMKLDRIQIVIAPLSNLGEDTIHLRCDAAGRFAAPKPLRPGRYAIESIGVLPPDLFVQRTTLDGQEVPPTEFEINESARLEIKLSNGAGRIRGLVIDAESKAPRHSIVTIIPADGKSWPTKQESDEDGNFEFRGIRPGSYTVVAWERLDTDLWQDPDFLKEYGTRAVHTTVSPGESRVLELRAVTAQEMR